MTLFTIHVIIHVYTQHQRRLDDGHILHATKVSSVQLLISWSTVLRMIASFSPVLEITVSHWPFPDQSQHLANQNPF